MPDVSANPPFNASLAPKPIQSPPLQHLHVSRVTTTRVLSRILLTLATIFFLLHFLHLSADFPNHSQWVDWSKYTDEGWYGDAAIRHYLSGHWYWKGDFNPAVALPVWPAIELLVFKFTGVSTFAARSLTLCVFGITLITLYLLIGVIRDHAPAHQANRLRRQSQFSSFVPARCSTSLNAWPSSSHC